jgi:hypothetical protein
VPTIGNVYAARVCGVFLKYGLVAPNAVADHVLTKVRTPKRYLRSALRGPQVPEPRGWTRVPLCQRRLATSFGYELDCTASRLRQCGEACAVRCCGDGKPIVRKFASCPAFAGQMLQSQVFQSVVTACAGR